MRRQRILVGVGLGLALACGLAGITLRPPAARAAASSQLTLGVFLPTTIADGQERFNFGEHLAAALAKALGRPVQARNFARYQDFADAASHGKLDIGVVDGWIAAQSSDKFVPVALGSLGGETRLRWAIIAHQGRSVADLAGRRLSLTHGAGPTDVQFVSNVVFGGDLAAQKHFKLVYVPAVESAIKMIDVDSAEAALIPVVHVPKKSRVLYRSSPVLAAAVLSLRGNANELRAALGSVGAVAPFDKFVTTRTEDVASLRKLIIQGPPPRQPFMAEAPILRFDSRQVITFRGIGLVFPSFVHYMDVSKELPDD